MTDLSMADIARLAGVKRPVVTMWSKRLTGVPFPPRQPQGGYRAADVVAYLEKTGRGNNPDARTDLALASALAPASTQERLRSLRTLVALRALTDRPLGGLDPDDLLDLADELDPDDAWLYSEVKDADDLLAGDADAIAETAWSVGDTVERLHDAAEARAGAQGRLASELSGLLAHTAAVLRGASGALVDVAGTATDAVLALLAERDESEGVQPPVLLAGEHRTARLRYAVQGVDVRMVDADDDWALPDGSVVLLHLPGDPAQALDLLDRTALQLGPTTRLLVTGPAAVLVDELKDDLGRRDAFLRDDQLRAVVRLPQGLERHESRLHLGLWAVQSGASDRVWVGDLSGRPLEAASWSALLDDLVAAFEERPRLRAFALLRPARGAHLLSGRRSLVGSGTEFKSDLAPSAADDAVQLAERLAALAAASDDPFDGLTVAVRGQAQQRFMTLGDACERRWAKVVNGHRLDALPPGSTRLWTAQGLAAGASETVDLVTLTTQHPQAHLTEPGDVVFATDGRPRAIVDADGGGVVAFPARIVRVSSARLSPRAIAAAINALPAGDAKWRAWQVPVVTADAAAVEDALARLDTWERDLRARLDLVADARRLYLRSGLCGAIGFDERNH